MSFINYDKIYIELNFNHKKCLTFVKSLFMINILLSFKSRLIKLIIFCCFFIPSFIIANPVHFKFNKEKKTYLSQYENVLGTSLELKVKATNNKQAILAEKIALSEIARLSKILSAYDKNSEFSIWCTTKGAAVKVSPELFEVFANFDKWNILTNGALNPAFEEVNKIWNKAQVDQIIPNDLELMSAVKIANNKHWSIDHINRTVTHLTNSPLVFNTFVKSYIIQKVTQKIINETGISNIVLNIGGDIIAQGKEAEIVQIVNPKADAINDPAIDQVSLQNKFVATSGSYRRGLRINNEWYSHIIDPRNGMPTGHIISATVIAKDPVDAGALATSFNILSLNESIELAKNFPDVAYLIVTKNGELIKSANWKDIEIAIPNSLLPTDLTLKENKWDPSFELAINLELAQFQGPSRRPFVAIWVEDKDPVRNLALWYNKPRWLHDLRAWYSANYAKYNVESGSITSLTSATRSPGKYIIKWDGKDDNGNYVKTGNYTINIEVVREHGTYQIITQEIKINNKSDRIELKANAEVAAASLEFKKKIDE